MHCVNMPKSSFICSGPTTSEMPAPPLYSYIHVSSNENYLISRSVQ